jgi:predicted metal-dependent hydrolase
MHAGEPAQLELPFDSRSLREPRAGGTLTVLNGQVVEYTIRRVRRRRSITLTIDEHGLRVGAPLRANRREIESVLQQHAKWVLRTLDRWTERRPVGCTWRSGETLFLLGTALRLEPGADGVERHGNTLTAGPFDSDTEVLRARVVAWYRSQALICFDERIAHYVGILGVRVSHLRLSQAKTRWGSCGANGRVTLNWRLIQMPLELIDYVVVHELAHLREMNHSPRFWRAVERVLPDYAARRAALRHDAYRYLRL